MIFLIDAQLPRRLARMLQQYGHQAYHTLDLPRQLNANLFGCWPSITIRTRMTTLQSPHMALDSVATLVYYAA